MKTRHPSSPQGSAVRSITAVLAATVGAALIASAACNPAPSGTDEPPIRDPDVPGCINACYVDELPEPVDCAAAEEGTEFYPLAIWTMEGSASNMYSYWDSTTPNDYIFPGIWEPPTNSTIEFPGGVSTPSHYVPPEGLPPEVTSLPRCLGQQTNGVLHLFGGPFTEWGGGVGRGMKCLNRAPDQLLGRVKVGEDTTKPNADVTDVSCGSSPEDILGGPALGACADDSTISENDPDYAEKLARRELVKSACPERDRRARAIQSEAGAEPGAGAAAAGEEEFLLGMTLDVSAWDGISFWARRSPNSQAGIRLVVGDKRTDDDLRYLQYHINPDSEPFCERNRECGCPDRKPCTENQHPTAGVYCSNDSQCNRGQGSGLCQTDVGRCRCTRDQECPSGWCEFPPDAVYGSDDGLCRAMSFCYDPEVDPAPESWLSAEGEQVFPSCSIDADCTGGTTCVETPYGNYRICWKPGDPMPLNPVNYLKCGEAACNAYYQPFQVGDAQFNERACTPFVFRGGTDNSFCFEPGVDPDPVEGVGQCGDFWMAPVRLSTEWKLYKVPFTELHQQGWAKEQFEFDLKSVSVVRFTWDRGWIDYWIDDVRFYREKR